MKFETIIFEKRNFHAQRAGKSLSILYGYILNTIAYSLLLDIQIELHNISAHLIRDHRIEVCFE